MSDAPSTPAATHADGVVDVAPAPPAEALFSPRQIAVATLVATPLAGALLSSWNVRALGRSGATRALVVVAGAALTALIFAIDVWGAGAFTLWALPLSAALAFCASTIAFARWLHTTPRRSLASVAAVVVACWLALGVVGGGVVAAMQLRTPSLDEALGDSVAFSSGERVHYRDGARREDAEQIARALAATGYFTGGGSLRVAVDKPNAEVRIAVLVPDDATTQDLDAARAMIKSLARALERCVPARVITANGDTRVDGRLCP